MSVDDATSPEDEDRLNELFGQFVEALSDGRDVDVEELLADRPDLITRGKELFSIANEIAVRRPVDVPVFSGYELISEIGRGGMGKVYLARHIELGRTVALKTLPPQWMTGDRARQRFEREARAVARLKHSNIIPIYDIGEEDGVPYFTMEFVKGRTLASVLDGLRELGEASHKLTSAHLGRERAGSQSEPFVKRVARFALDIARALEHAHGEGVVHRDVKPSNILVRPNGTAMLFDFGLATVESEEVLTLTGEFLGTPHYVSPEQAAGERLYALTDVFSLGSTLYELLTLERPFSGVTTQDILRQVQERDPRPPSRLNAAVPRDLETICLTALAKEPGRRYQFAAAFADDLERFLDSRPIQARPVGPVGRTWLLARRHPAVAISMSLGALLLFGTPTALFLQARGANREIRAALTATEVSEAEAKQATQDALRERDIAREISGVLEDMIGSVNPENGGREARIFELLDSVSESIQSLRPEVRAALEKSLATSYLTLTMNEEADIHFERAFELYATLPDTPVETLRDLRTDFYHLRTRQSRYEEALEGFALLTAEFEEAGQLGKNYMISQGAIGVCLLETGRYIEAESMFRKAIEISSSLEEDGLPIPMFEHNLALVLAYKTEYEAAIALITSAYERRLEAKGPRDPNTVDSLMMLAQIVKESGDLEAATPLLEQAMDACLDVYGEDDMRSVGAVHNLAGLVFEMGDLEAAEELELQALDMAEGNVEAEDPFMAYIHEILGMIRSQRGNFEGAVEAQRDSLRLRLEGLGSEHPLTIQAHMLMGKHLTMIGAYEESELELLTALEDMRGLSEPPRQLRAYIYTFQMELYRQTADAAKFAVAEAGLEVEREALEQAKKDAGQE